MIYFRGPKREIKISDPTRAEIIGLTLILIAAVTIVVLTPGRVMGIVSLISNYFPIR
jgi:hypothetical protein